jgi:hypothetical protein
VCFDFSTPNLGVMIHIYRDKVVSVFNAFRAPLHWNDDQQRNSDYLWSLTRSNEDAKKI